MTRGQIRRVAVNADGHLGDACARLLSFCDDICYVASFLHGREISRPSLRDSVVHGQCREIVQLNRLESYRFTSPRNWKELGEILTRRSARSSSISEQNIHTIYVYAIFKVFIKHS